MVPLSWYLILGAIVFVIGMAGLLMRRNLIAILLSAELMLNSVSINFVAFSHYMQSLMGQAFVVFILVIAAAEAAIGLALIIAIYRIKETLNVDELNSLKG